MNSRSRDSCSALLPSWRSASPSKTRSSSPPHAITCSGHNSPHSQRRSGRPHLNAHSALPLRHTATESPRKSDTSFTSLEQRGRSIARRSRSLITRGSPCTSPREGAAVAWSRSGMQRGRTSDSVTRRAVQAPSPTARCERSFIAGTTPRSSPPKRSGLHTPRPSSYQWSACMPWVLSMAHGSRAKHTSTRGPTRFASSIRL